MFCDCTGARAKLHFSVLQRRQSKNIITENPTNSVVLHISCLREHMEIGKYNHECVKSRTRPVVTGRSLIRSLWGPISWQALENKGRLWKTSQVYRATHVGGTMRGNHAFFPLPLLLLHVHMFWLSAYFLFRTSSNLSLKGQCHKSLLERGIIFMPRINVF